MTHADHADLDAPADVEKVRPAFGQWLPIETAPENLGVLVFSPDRCTNCSAGSKGITAARLEAGAWLTGRLMNGQTIALNHLPTHWMPLPQPPASPQSTSTDVPGVKTTEGGE